MKNKSFPFSLLALLMILLAGCCKQAPKVEPAIPADPAIEAQVKKIVSGLTLEEKIGQMCQLTIGTIEDYRVRDEFKINDEALTKMVRDFKVGSFLNTPRNVCQTRSTWHEIIDKIQTVSNRELHIPTIYGLDQIHGGTYSVGATLFPQGINMGASFNRDLVREEAAISAYETRACAVPWNFAPVLDLGRDPRWSRQWENFGEDPFINATMGVEAIKGFQGDDPNHIDGNHVAACLKHYMGYGVPTSGKDRTPSHITDAEMREKFFAPYLATIRAGALSVMVNSANNNGIPLHASYKYLTQWLGGAQLGRSHRHRLGRHPEPLHPRPCRRQPQGSHQDGHQRRHRHEHGSLQPRLLHAAQGTRR